VSEYITLLVSRNSLLSQSDLVLVLLML